MSKSAPQFWNRSGKKTTYCELRQSGDTCVLVSQAAAINQLAGREIWTETDIVAAFNRTGEPKNFDTVRKVALEPVSNEIVAIEHPRDAGSLPPTVDHIGQWIDAGGIVILSLQKSAKSASGFHRHDCWHMFSLIGRDGNYFETWDTNGYHGYLSHSEIENGFVYTDGSWYLPHLNKDALYLKRLST